MPSAAIEAFSYDEALSELTIRFVGGATYVYWMVPAAVAAALAAAPSRGAFVNARIKDRFPFRKIAEAEKAPRPAKRPKRHGASLKDKLDASLFEDK
jgi:lysyl-tRNA synthetase class 2